MHVGGNMALTPEQNRSMERFLFNSTGKNTVGTRKKREFEVQENKKAITEDILDGALKQIEET